MPKDLIDREEAMKILIEYDTRDACVDQIKESMSYLPSLPDKSSDWIPVSERLPEEDQEVLGFDGTSQEVVKLWNTDIGSHFVDCRECMETDITHWQLLPSPPAL